MHKVAVIGSGFGGLATAIRLQGQGFDVEIFEKRDKPGGRAYVFEDAGYTFDAGPTVITAPQCIDELFEIAGRRTADYIEMMPVTPMYRLAWENGFRFDYSSDLESTLAQIAKKSPRDAGNYPRFLEYTRQVFEAGYTDLAHVPFLDWWSMIRVSPELMKLQAFRSVYSMVSRYISDPDLRQAFSFHSLLVGGNPFSASSIYTLIHYLERKWGVFFPRGGTGALVKALVRVFEEMGGKLHLNAEVSEILTADARVKGLRTKDGDKAFDIVVSNADVTRTYVDLLKGEPRVEGARRKLVRSHHSMSLFLVYFGTNRKYSEVAQHNVLFGKRYRELLADIFDRGKLADDFSLYLHASTKSDPTLAPEGGEAFYALSPVPHLGKGDIDWEVEGPRYAERILSYLEKHYLPDLKKHIVTQRIFTPRHFETELNAHLGSAFSLEPRLTQSAYFRVHNRDKRIRGLYFVGAGTHPGAGIPGVVNSAKATSGLVIDDFAPASARVTKTTDPGAALEECRKMIEVGSKSFSFAAKLFSPDTRDAAFLLYGWCRYCDDQIDSVEDPILQAQRAEELKAMTQAAFRGERLGHSAYLAMGEIARRHQIPLYYAEELIEGMSMDVRREQYPSVSELGLYCYRVAGTVGLMMSHVMGVSDARALRHAASLGIAMQMTNIARDVWDDFAMGRVYLPLDWLEEAGVPVQSVGAKKFAPLVAQVVRRLLAAADGYYREGTQGLKYLPFRAAIAVAVAARVYSRIGKLVERRGARAWERRCVVSRMGKCLAAVEGLFLVLRTVPFRLLRPWRQVALESVWKHT